MTQMNGLSTPPSALPNVKSDFFAKLGSSINPWDLFNHLPGIAFFAKDSNFRLVAANRSFWERLGVASEDAIIGKDDFELFPGRLAHSFRTDDMEVLATGKPKLRIVELFITPEGLPDWYVTNKLPILSQEGKPIGVMGTVEDYRGVRLRLEPFEAVSAAVDHIRTHYREPIRVGQLAEASGISERQLHRKFKDAFGIGPRQFILKTRLHAAYDELTHSLKPISDIALEHGFYDQSSFTQYFRRQFGFTPLKQRRQAIRKTTLPRKSS